MKEKTKKIRFGLVVGIMMTMLLISSIGFYLVLNSGLIYQGVYIEGMDVGGLTREEALRRIEPSFDAILKKRKIILQYEETKFSFPYKAFGVTYDYHVTINEAFSIGREGNIFRRFFDIVDTRRHHRQVDMPLLYDRDKMNYVLKQVGQALNQESKNADITLIKDAFHITPEVLGRHVQYDDLERSIIECFRMGRDQILRIPMKETHPRILETHLKTIKDVVGSSVTYFNPGNEGRVANIKLAAEAINGKVLLTGDVFSFNDTTGPRTAHVGYEEANVVINGKLVPDTGGGVCQVSSTLYNSILLSNLEIVERHHHSIPVGYVAKGRDATLSYDYLDLKFKNNFSHPIYIDAKAQNNSVAIRIFGHKEDKNYTVTIETKLVEVVEPEVEVITDSKIAPGQQAVIQEGRSGYKIDVFRIIHKNNQEIGREKLHRDYYKPQKRIIKKGREVQQTEGDALEEAITESEE